MSVILCKKNEESKIHIFNDKFKKMYINLPIQNIKIRQIAGDER